MELGHTLNTFDKYSIDEFDLFIFLDLPKKNLWLLKQLKKLNKVMYLIILESPIINTINLKTKYHRYFKFIFTYNDSKISNEKYILSPIPQSFPETSKIEKNFDECKFITIIASKRKVNKKKELYSERERIINWFEKKHPGKLDLYGFGWDRYVFNESSMLRIFNRFKILSSLYFKTPKSYCGTTPNKLKTLESYKFCICYENVREVSGYITEKLFDCFFSKCIPIYLGSNIEDYIDEGCYIDMRKFKNYEELYQYVENITKLEYHKYIDCIEAYLRSSKARMFTATAFANRIIEKIEKE